MTQPDRTGVRAAIMQPYFLPYLGYFQLISCADVFVVYDNIQYTKKGWINRNRILSNNEASTITVPLRRESDYLDIRYRHLADDFSRAKLLNQIRSAYRRAPYFASTMALVEQVMADESPDLFTFLHRSITLTCEQLEINTRIVVSSDLDIDHTLRGEQKVLALCAAVGADSYVNAIGGVDLYSRETFAEAGVALSFIKSEPFAYEQFGAAFIPWLSIVDVMMFNSPETVFSAVSTGYELV